MRAAFRGDRISIDRLAMSADHSGSDDSRRQTPMDPIERRDYRGDLTRTVLAILIIGGLIVASLWILRPFLAATIWSTMIVVTTWPVLRTLQSRLWGKRWLATTVMTLALLLLFVIPLSAAIGTIVANSGEIVDWASRLARRKAAAPAGIRREDPCCWREGRNSLARILGQGLGRARRNRKALRSTASRPGSLRRLATSVSSACSSC